MPKRNSRQTNREMTQIILNVSDNAQIPKLRTALKLLDGVVSVRVKKEAKRNVPNKETLVAMEEAKSGKPLETLPVDDFHNYVASL